MTERKARKAGTRKEREVWEVCDKMNREKKALTYFAIGEQLVESGYKRGSNSDIRRYLKSWRKNHSFSCTTQPLPIPKEEIHQSAASDETKFVELLHFYEHHLEQFDRLLDIIELLKTENRLLRQKLNMPDKVFKPRISYRQTVET